MKSPMTQRGAELLRQELTQLKNVERPKVSQQIAEARSHGDLSENAEYEAAREKQGLMEAQRYPEDYDGLIVGVIAPGYQIGDDILRPAQVAVARV